MQRIARRVGLLGTVRVAAESGDDLVVIGTRYRPAAGVWTLYRDREPVGQVAVLGIAAQGARSVPHLAEPLPVDLRVGDEIGERMVTVIVGTVAGPPFLFVLGNVATLGIRLGVPAYVAIPVAPSDDLSVQRSPIRPR
ncbi:hypothetical protein [Parafrankia sp. EUN1f]|uniref:hypothetical protein n=1 Tax=Parafrankia sp. EUN1f TaxID=102897 RepID=UPI0001C44274|nr:hypothetical protein [Parafrankia sp. EUN1f]EFC85347.1 hypothetical protein FrEUN1fDRAFT_1494 [Parafrankia sp. EUN1f]